MFNFDGDFRQRPQQNLGGATKSVNRNEIVRKAQHERHKRELLRTQQNSAVLIQSFVRSFCSRQRIKRSEKKQYDDYIKRKGSIKFEDLDFLLKRMIFFYNSNIKEDGERLISLCQVVLKSSSSMINLAIVEPTWCYRLQKLLGFCMAQIFIPDLSPAIPFRMLECYTSRDKILPTIQNPIKTNVYLQQIFSYLIRKNYFRSVRQLIEDKIPELDEEKSVAINPVSEAIMEMLLRPLKLVDTCNQELSDKILASFTYHILSIEFVDAVKYFIIPALAESADFPYFVLLNFLRDDYRKQVELKNTILIDIEDEPANKKGKDQDERVEPIYSSFLLYAILRLDQNHLERIKDTDHLSNYIEVIASMVDTLSMLPKISYQRHKQHDDSSDSEDDDNDNDVEMQTHTERTILLEIIQMLNEQKRVLLIIEQIESCFDRFDLVLCLCKICHNLMTYNRLAVYEYKLLYMLASKPQFIRTLYCNLTSQTSQQGFQAPISLLSKGIIIPKYEADKIIPLLATFCALFGRLIATLHDGEFTQENLLPGTQSQIMPFTLQEVVPLSTTLKEICLGLVELAFPETRVGLRNHYGSVLSSIYENKNMGAASNAEINKNVYPHLMKVCVSLLRQLHTRDLRCSFCPEGHWAAQNLNLPLDKTTDVQFVIGRRYRPRPFQPIKDFTRDDLENGPPMSTKQIRSITILREIPFVVAFNTRVGIFQGLLAADKLRSQGDLQGFLQGPSINIKVRRSHLYEDAFDKLSKDNEPDLRPRFRVQMVSAVGLEECGIDGGGVFREFLSELLKAAFDPHRGFFMISKDNMLYPNPYVGKIYENYQKHYYFIGRILGKALYENLLVELPLAEFFLSKLAGKHADVDIHQMASLDPVLHRSLMSLKAYEGDVSDLGLDFTVVCDELGETRIEELKPNGANITVNSSNRIEYIQLMADFKLNRQIRSQCASFRQGLADVLPIEWLYMFSNKELQTLISGAETAIDVEDMKVFTRYGGEYSLEHPTIELFWKVVSDFDDLQRRQLLKFVTSCSRPPLLGFKDLDPPFTIHQNSGETDRLPSASTCMNLLKLPPFTNEELMREKVLYAIQSGSGFELS